MSVQQYRKELVNLMSYLDKFDHPSDAIFTQEWLAEIIPNNICHYFLFCIYSDAKIFLDNRQIIAVPPSSTGKKPSPFLYSTTTMHGLRLPNLAIQLTLLPLLASSSNSRTRRLHIMVPPLQQGGHLLKMSFAKLFATLTKKLTKNLPLGGQLTPALNKMESIYQAKGQGT